MTECKCNSDRVTDLLRANEREVNNRRRLAKMLGRCQEQFLFYAEQHFAKKTPEADLKGAVNIKFVEDIEEAFNSIER